MATLRNPGTLQILCPALPPARVTSQLLLTLGSCMCCPGQERESAQENAKFKMHQVAGLVLLIPELGRLRQMDFLSLRLA